MTTMSGDGPSKWEAVRVAAAVAVQLTKKDLETLRKMPSPPLAVQVRANIYVCNTGTHARTHTHTHTHTHIVHNIV